MLHKLPIALLLLRALAWCLIAALLVALLALGLVWVYWLNPLGIRI